jgi:hypothetical protein
LAGNVDFKGLFLIPCGAAIVAAIALALFFRPPEDKKSAVADSPRWRIEDESVVWTGW